MVITQNDDFVIPKNILMLAEASFLDLDEIVIVKSPKSLTSKKFLFLFGFGLIQCTKLQMKLISKKFLSLLSKILKRPKATYLSIRGVAKLTNCRFTVITDPNDRAFVADCISRKLDVIVSYSAPSVFKTELLTASKYGCINLHCSLLPNYAGSLPSFWTLNDGAEEIGASIHVMDSKIDNGPLLKQVKAVKPDNLTMYENIKLTKAMGGMAMLEVLADIHKYGVLRPLNSRKPDFHYVWPTISDIRSFRTKGGRLV